MRFALPYTLPYTLPYIAISFLMLLVLSDCWDVQAQTAKNLQHAKYMGVGSCSSSNCHGSVSPREATNVLQNEYTTWNKHDAHAQAWAVLANEDSKRIGMHMGIANPEKEPLCLKCHATYVPKGVETGERYRVDDGVGCESCHGAAEHYLAQHAEQGATHSRNLELGLQDLVSNGKRAELCLSCHYGTDDKTVDHALIGAGHPRLTFELDTFTALQPAHWLVDKDYVSRKADYSPAAAWLEGQVARSISMLDAWGSESRSRFGSGFMQWPELTLMYCYTCHHGLNEQQWKSREYGGKPGELRLNVSSISMVAEALKVLDAGTGKKLESALSDLHRSGDPAAAAASLRSLLKGLNAKGASANAKGLLKAFAQLGADGGDPPFEVAEQITMAISAMVAEISPDQSLYKRQIDQIYESLREPHTYQPAPFAAACAKMLKAI